MLPLYYLSRRYLVVGTAVVVALFVALPTYAVDLNLRVGNPTPFTSVEAFIQGVLNVIMILATPIIVLVIMYSGFLYVTARGNAEQVKQATRSLTYAIIGAILILGAVVMSGIIKDLILSL